MSLPRIVPSCILFTTLVAAYILSADARVYFVQKDTPVDGNAVESDFNEYLLIASDSLDEKKATTCLHVEWSDRNCLVGPFYKGVDIAEPTFLEVCRARNGKFPVSQSPSLYVICHGDAVTINQCPQSSRFLPDDGQCHLTQQEKEDGSDDREYRDTEDENPGDGSSLPQTAAKSLVIPIVSSSSKRSRPALSSRRFVSTTTESNNLCRQGEGIYPHPSSCQLFIHCAPGQQFIKRCPAPTTVFNPDLSICDWPRNVPECDGTDNLNSISNERDSRTLDTLVKLLNSVDKNPSKRGSRGVKKCDDSNLINIHEHCNKFVTCSNGKNYIRVCPPGTNFDPINKGCESVTTVDCASRLSDLGTYACYQGMKYSAPHPEYCNKFIECHNGKLFVKHCGGDLVYNPFVNACDYKSKVKCTKPISLEGDIAVNFLPPLTNTSANPTNELSQEIFSTDQNVNSTTPTESPGVSINSLERSTSLPELETFEELDAQPRQPRISLEPKLSPPELSTSPPETDTSAELDTQPKGSKFSSEEELSPPVPVTTPRKLETSAELDTQSKEAGIPSEAELFSSYLSTTPPKPETSAELDTHPIVSRFASELSPPENKPRMAPQNVKARSFQAQPRAYTTEAPKPAQLVCTNRGEDYIAPHPEFCNQFVECENGGLFFKRCGPGTVYNRYDGWCDWARNTREPIHGSCDSYAECRSGIYQAIKCRSRGTYYDPQVKECRAGYRCPYLQAPLPTTTTTTTTTTPPTTTTTTTTTTPSTTTITTTTEEDYDEWVTPS